MDELGILKEYGRLWRVYFEGAKKVHRFADYLNRYWIQRELENEAIHIHYLLQVHSGLTLKRCFLLFRHFYRFGMRKYW